MDVMRSSFARDRRSCGCTGWLPVVGCATVLLSLGGCGAPGARLQVGLERRQEARAVQAAHPVETSVSAVVPAEKIAAELLPDEVLTLEQARARAARGNPDIHAAQARLEAAAARVQQAHSYYLPSVSASHNSTRTFLTPASRNRIATSLQPSSTLPTDVADTNNFAVTTILNALRGPLFGDPDVTGSSSAFSEHATALTATWTVFDSFAREARLLGARYTRRASEHALADAQRLIRSAVDTAYFLVQLAQEQQRIAQADEVFSQEQFELTERLRAAGRATQADVNNFKVRLLDAQAQVSASNGAREAGRVALAELMGLAGTTLPPMLALSPLQPEAEAELTAPDPEPWIEQALRQRPDLLRLDQLVTSLYEEARAVRALYGPSVVVSGSWGYDRISTIRYEDDDQSSAVGVELRWDLYTGGRRTALVREAEALRAEGVAQLHRQRLAVQAQVHAAVIDVHDAQQQIHLQRENVKTAGQNRQIVQSAYAAGKETLTRLNEAQRDYVAADAALARARIQLRQAWSDLEAAAGGAGVEERTP